MVLKRKFEKMFNRSMPLLAAEYWYQGERRELSRLTERSMHFNPLFIYEAGQGSNVYYDINNPITDDQKLVSYFRTHPSKFKLLADKYEEECNRLIQLSQPATARRPRRACRQAGTTVPRRSLRRSHVAGVVAKDIATIFKLQVSFFSKLAVIFTLGKLVEDRHLKPIAQQAYNLRLKTDKVEYLSSDNLMSLVNDWLVDFKEYTDVLTLKEIVNKDIPNIKELQKRQAGYIYFEGKLYTDLTIKQLERAENIEIINDEFSNDQKNDKFLKGTVAMPGKVSGRVKIVFELNQLDKVRAGDILVMAMTTPDYIMAMKRAAAFVTDEGGITCHAAIVAREMKKPCIIGTKVATTVLQDGDLVEVDANKGVVKTIKRD